MLYFEDQPLDLSTKSRNIESYSPVTDVTGGFSPIFNFSEFYRTYLEISQKSLDLYYSQQSFHQSPSPDMSKTVRAKRKLYTEFDWSEAKKVRRECRSERAELEEEKLHVSQTRLTKMMRRKKKEQITEIGQSCDCRTCYENHIRKLRLKMETAWPLL